MGIGRENNNKVANVIMIISILLILIFLFICILNTMDETYCLNDMGTTYCNDIGLNYHGLDESTHTKYFNCINDSNREITTFYFTKDEIDMCGSRLTIK